MAPPTRSYNFTVGTIIDSEQVDSEFDKLYNYFAGSVEADALTSAVRQQLGLTDATTVRRGKSIIATTESRTNTAYGTLATPDRVQNVVLPTDGLIVVAFQATWQESVAGAARAAIFLGSDQLKVSYQGGPSAQAAATGSVGVTAMDLSLASSGAGLSSVKALGGATNTGGDATTGQVVGLGVSASAVNEVAGAVVNSFSQPAGPCYIFAAAGTYTISVQFKSSSGSVTANNRKLWVKTETYA